MNWIIRNDGESPLIDYRYISIDIISLTFSSSFLFFSWLILLHMDFPRHRHQTSLDSSTMGCPHLFRRVWPRSYHWDAVHTVDDVDLPRCHSWVKRHPKNLGLSRSKEPGCMRSAHGFSTGIMERSMDLICSERSHILNFCVQVYSFPACFQPLRISPASPVAKPFTTARPCSRSIDHGTTTAKVSCSSASEKAGYFYRSQAMHSWCLQTLWIYLPFQSILWFELPIYLHINLLTIICKTWTTMSSPVRSILRQIPWTKKTFKAASKGCML